MDDLALMLHGRRRLEFSRPFALEVLQRQPRVRRQVLDHRLAGLEDRTLLQRGDLLDERRVLVAVGGQGRQSDAGVGAGLGPGRVQGERVAEAFDHGLVDQYLRPAGGRAVRACFTWNTGQPAVRPVAVVLADLVRMGPAVHVLRGSSRLGVGHKKFPTPNFTGANAPT